MRSSGIVACLNYNRFKVLRAVDSLNVRYELQSKRVIKTILLAVLYHADISK